MKLICPVCSKPLNQDNSGLSCENHHHFDRAKQGYYNLDITNKVLRGDSDSMTNSRISFLTSGAYDFLAQAVNQLLQDYQVTSVLDYACGPGIYLKQFTVDEKVGIDLSKLAIKKGAGYDKSSTYFVANGYHLPFEDNSFDCITIICAPYDLTYLKTKVKPSGYIIVASPAPYHLYELKQLLYSNVYLNEVKIPFHDGLSLIDTREVTNKTTLVSPQIMNCFSMTPYYYKTSKDAINNIASLPSLDITFSFTLHFYQINE